MKRLGVIGGMGTEESNQFCLAINSTLRLAAGVQADISLEHLPTSIIEEEKFIRGEETDEHRRLLCRAVGRLNKSEVDIIAIPCNTAHLFLEELRVLSEVPILSIVEECAKECQKRGFTKVGLLASTRTVQEKLFEKVFEQDHIQIMCPNKEQQTQISHIIFKTLNGTFEPKNTSTLILAIDFLHQQDCQAIILGCTNFSSLIAQDDVALPIIDSQKILQQAAITVLMG
ncbi:MAG: amino acid racemase [Nanoarchaeota archaeon]|nr:amino acid racemase [Nanoarchaeota archaeon]